MAKGPSYRVAFRRRREGKTNYRSRRALVLSKLPRLVVRHTLRQVIVHIVQAEVTGDTVIASSHSQELVKTYGWQGSPINIPAAYLTGLLCGLKAKTQGIEHVVLDIGLNTPSKGAKVFAALKGVLDAGVEVPHQESILPDNDRIEGKHIVEYANQLLSDPDIYQHKFSGYLSRKLRPEHLTQHFLSIKQKLDTAYGRTEK